MSQSLDHFLDAARVGDELFRPSPANTRVLDAVLESLMSLGAGEEHVEIDVPPDCHADVDAFHLATILTNLIGNSLKYGERPVVVTAQTTDRVATIEVSRLRPGVAPDVTDRLFDRYTRAEAAEGDGRLRTRPVDRPVAGPRLRRRPDLSGEQPDRRSFRLSPPRSRKLMSRLLFVEDASPMAVRTGRISPPRTRSDPRHPAGSSRNS